MEREPTDAEYVDALIYKGWYAWTIDEFNSSDTRMLGITHENRFILCNYRNWFNHAVVTNNLESISALANKMRDQIKKEYLLVEGANKSEASFVSQLMTSRLAENMTSYSLEDIPEKVVEVSTVFYMDKFNEYGKNGIGCTIKETSKFLGKVLDIVQQYKNLFTFMKNVDDSFHNLRF